MVGSQMERESNGKRVTAPQLLKYFKFKVGPVLKTGLMDLGFAIAFDIFLSDEGISLMQGYPGCPCSAWPTLPCSVSATAVFICTTSSRLVVLRTIKSLVNKRVKAGSQCARCCSEAGFVNENLLFHHFQREEQTSCTRRQPWAIAQTRYPLHCPKLCLVPGAWGQDDVCTHSPISFLGCWEWGESQGHVLRGEILLLKISSRTSHQDFGLGQCPADRCNKPNPVYLCPACLFSLPALAWGNNHAENSNKSEKYQNEGSPFLVLLETVTPSQADKVTICVIKNVTSTCKLHFLLLPFPPTLHITLALRPMKAARAASSFKSQESSPEWNPHIPWVPLWHLNLRYSVQIYLSVPSQHDANLVLNAMFPPYILADRAILSCIREVADYVTCDMPKAIRLYWFSDSCCVGLGIFHSLLWSRSAFGRNVRTPMSQWKESPWRLAFNIS